MLEETVFLHGGEEGCTLPAHVAVAYALITLFQVMALTLVLACGFTPFVTSDVYRLI